MTNDEFMGTKRAWMAKKPSLPIIMLILCLAVGGVAVTAAAAKGQGPSPLHPHLKLNFGLLSSSSTGKDTFANALVVGRGTTSPIRFAFANSATTWNRVFSGISIVIQTRRAQPVTKACISLGTGVCPAGLTATFTPASSTTYDYVATFTTVSKIPSGVTLQTTGSSS
jgi:hypothetical protein